MTDHKTVRLVVLLLGFVTLALVAAIGLLAYQEKELPEGLLTLAGSGLGALSALLASTRGTPSGDGGGGLTVTNLSVDASSETPAP